MTFVERHVVLIAITTALLVIGLILRWIADFAGDEIEGIRNALSSSLPKLQDFLVEFGSGLWAAWCYVYVLQLKIKSWGQNKVFNTVIGVLLVASIYVVIEIGIDVLHFLTDGAVDPNGQPVAHHIWLILHIHTPMWVEFILLLLAFLMVWHHWMEWRLRVQNLDMPRVTTALLLRLERLRTPGTNVCTPQAKEEFVEELMTRFLKKFGNGGGRKKIWFSLMKPYGGNLVVTKLYSADSKWIADRSLATGIAGAVRAFSDGSAIYIPSTRHRMGISVESQKPIGVVYKEDTESATLRSLLCVPVLLKGNVVAVLNVCCNRPSAFNAFHLDVARLTAALLGTAG